MWTLLIAMAAAAPSLGETSSIAGRVQNGTRPTAIVVGAEIVLRTEIDGQLAVVETTVTDDDGCFHFDELPVDGERYYLVGANFDDVHYPGPRVCPKAGESSPVTLVVYDAMSSPSPLMIRSQQVVLRVKPSVIEVRQELCIDNPTLTSFVGLPSHDRGPAVTLKLDVPETVERITFDHEAWARQFTIVNHQLVTSLPFPPGQRRLAFTYWMPVSQQQAGWQQSLNLPCQQYTLDVEGVDRRQISCNLPTPRFADADALHFDRGQPLPASFVVTVALKELAVPVSNRARHVALAVASGLTLMAIATAWRARRWSPPPEFASAKTVGSAGPHYGS